MNERIKELEKQAWDYAYEHETVKGKVAHDGFINMNFSDAFSEKFAELIVRECIKELENDTRCRIAGADKIVAKHFGVKE